MEIPPDIYNRLRKTFVRCSQFNSHRELQAIFVDTRLSPWYGRLPIADQLDSRINITIDLLSRQYKAGTHENALVLLLCVLCDQTNPADALHQDLLDLANKLESLYESDIVTKKDFSSTEKNVGIQLPGNVYINMYTELFRKLREKYKLKTKKDIVQSMVEIGIGETESVIIADAFDKVGFEGYISISEGSIGSGYSLCAIDTGRNANKYTDSEALAEIKRLKKEIEMTKDFDKKAKLRKKLAEISGGMITIIVNYWSAEELQAKKLQLPVYIEIAREIIVRSR